MNFCTEKSNRLPHEKKIFSIALNYGGENNDFVICSTAAILKRFFFLHTSSATRNVRVSENVSAEMYVSHLIEKQSENWSRSWSHLETSLLPYL